MGDHTFTCGTCHDLIEKAADDEVVALLSSAGVCVDLVPGEVLETHRGAPITYDDVLDLALWLETHDDRAASRRAVITDVRRSRYRPLP